MLQEVKVNTFEMNGKIEILNRLIQTVKKEPSGHFGTE